MKKKVKKENFSFLDINDFERNRKRSRSVAQKERQEKEELELRKEQYQIWWKQNLQYYEKIDEIIEYILEIRFPEESYIYCQSDIKFDDDRIGFSYFVKEKEKVFEDFPASWIYRNDWKKKARIKYGN